MLASRGGAGLAWLDLRMNGAGGPDLPGSNDYEQLSGGAWSVSDDGDMAVGVHSRQWV